MALRALGDLKRQVKDLRYDEVEIMVRNATSNNPVGATPEQLHNIVDAFTATHHYHRMYALLWKRCNDHEHKIHMVKGLQLALYLLKNMEDRDTRLQLHKDFMYQLPDIKHLMEFSDVRETSQSHGSAIRVAAQELYDYMFRQQTLVGPNAGKKKPAPAPAPASTPVVAKPRKKKAVVTEKKQEESDVSDSEENDDKQPPYRAVPPPAATTTAPPPPPSKPVYSIPDEFGAIFAEDAQREAEKREMERREAERRELERIEAERKEAERKEADRLAKLKKEAEAREAATARAAKEAEERKELEKRSKLESEKREAERKAKAEADRLREAERLRREQEEAERLRKEKEEAERLRREKEEAAKREAEKREAERREAEKREAARKAQEAKDAEEKRLALLRRPAKLPWQLKQDVTAFAKYISSVCKPTNDSEKELLKETWPVDGEDLLLKIRDGTLLTRFINILQPNTIDERALNTQIVFGTPEADSLAAQNLSMVISAAKSLGIAVVGAVTITTPRGDANGDDERKGTALHPTDLLNYTDVAKCSITIDFLWGLIKTHMLREVSLESHPELIALQSLTRATDARDNPLPRQRGQLSPLDEHTLAIEHLSKLIPERLLLRWFHYHLKRCGDHRRVISLKDSVCYNTLLSAICSADIPIVPAPSPEKEPTVQECLPPAQAMLTRAANAGVPVYIVGQDVAVGNPRLNLMLIACIFNTNTGIKDLPIAPIKRQATEDYNDNSEARCFKMWINSLGIENVHVRDLIGECADGLLLLQVIDHVTGLVDWKKVEMDPHTRLKKVSNCNYAVELGKELKFSLVNVGGVDLADGNVKLILSLVWQLMRNHIVRFLDALMKTASSEQKVELTDASIDGLLVTWANSRIASCRPSEQWKTLQGAVIPPSFVAEPIKSFKDKQLSNSYFFFSVLTSLHPGLVNWSIVSPTDLHSNAKYCISLAMKLGTTIFLVPEDIVELKARMIMTLVASLMTLSLMK